ncbi:MAG: SOUL family heme-binding protein [Labrys sp. (in: a-proteobacteria)]
MRRFLKWFGLAVVVVAVAGFVWSQFTFVEEPKFTLIESSGGFELRDYGPIIVAETAVTGERDAAINAGFRLIADYIFGNNSVAQSVAMTAPVTQQPNQTIAMTAPVTQAGSGSSWTVQFIMPAQYTMETLPKPNNPAVTLRAIPGERVAVIRFSGVADEKLLAEKTAELKTMMESRKLVAAGDLRYAFYNPPWVLGPLRRNEVVIPVVK